MVNDLSIRQLSRHSDALLGAVQRGLASKPLKRPANHNRPDDQTLNRLERLRNWRKQTGKNLGVESDVILPRDMMERLAQNRPACIDDLALLMQDLPWRLEHFGPELLRILTK